MSGTAEAHDAARPDVWRRARRIVCLRLDNLGDVLMTSPALRALKVSHPNREITLLASPSGAAVAPHIPEVDSVIQYEAPWIKHERPASADQCDELIDLLYEGAFDAAVIFTVYSQSALPAALSCWLARIPLRLAYCRENPYELLTDWEQDPEPHTLVRHEVRRQLDLVAAVGCRTPNERLSFRLRAEDRATALAKLASAGVDVNRRWIVVHPGASAPSRCYPAQGYAQAIATLDEFDAYQVLVTGSAGERELAESIAARAQCGFAIAGMLELGELGWVLSRATLLISNNTGPVHIAAAVGTPVVDLYALTNPQHAPWQVPSRVLYHDVPCRFCYRSVCVQQHHACLRKVSPERVAAAARSLLESHADRQVVSPPEPIAQHVHARN